jgi:chromosome segregation protein
MAHQIGLRIITSRDATKLRLKQINLAGFKSFVDPTHIPVPGQLVGIVGPNGCGKSNVIDAVRWVLGETSARHLRGENMQDVLFNGSGQRQPVNRASVELVFDNSLGRAGGQWSSYAEISVKRVLERGGEATAYYINNIHVRRRDVADIFLGTGLGSRAYAIIEQGMITRVIEAKPEELRVFLEEAAGVSKYRERRRETELRLADTRENLLRVEDIRQELAQQIEHLQAQAEVAKRYHDLQERLRTAQGLLWLLRKQEAAAARARCARELERLALELEAGTARLRETERRLEALRVQHQQVADALHAAQGAYYEANAETARLEQEIAHQRENRSRVEREIAELEAQLARDRDQLAAAQASLVQWQEELGRARERLTRCEAAAAEEADKLPVAEEAFRATRNRYEALQRALAQCEQALEVEQTKLVHATQWLEQLAQRAQRLHEERRAQPVPDATRLAELRLAIAREEAALSAAREQLACCEQELPLAENTQRERDAALEAAGQRVAALQARLNALVQLQQRLARGAGTEEWIERHGLARARRAWQGMRIEGGWEDALEAVLRERLDAIALDELGQAARWFAEPPPAKLALYVPGLPDSPPEAPPTGLEPLLRYVRCHDAGLQAVLAEWLWGVYVVSDPEAAFAARGHLPAGAILVTREGHIVTRHGVSFHAPDSELHGVLSRQREIEELERALQEESAGLALLREAAAAAGSRVEEQRARMDELRAAIAGLQQRHHALQLEALQLAGLEERIRQRAQRIAEELAEIGSQQSAAAASQSAAQARIAELRVQTAELREQLALATDLYRRAETVLELQRQAWQRAREQVQQATFDKTLCENKIEEIENTIRAVSENSARLAAALEARCAERASHDDTPLLDRLQQALALRAQREQALARARDTLQGVEASLRASDEERQGIELELEPLREKIGEARLKEQEARLSEEQYAGQLAQAGAREEALVRLLEKGARAGALQSEIARLAEEIEALGAVNLAALEELDAARARKDYLDAQSRDLSEAMATLEDAIRRIDRETREKLQHTFDEVNRHFGELFPALFGGGHARLTLTGEEILDAGVQVTAQPPGKKTTSIHLLSGGEKALAALALVFALFQLNPAPFCLLDEVDAPLDDHNTERFCELVKKMSKHSQFLFISHNKITMEIAEQLLGITMQEPGVSRVVAVDIEEAMKLREAAA